MMRHTRLQHRFVEQMPERLEHGVLYVSMEYATSIHSCCCGCGSEVVAPFTPTDWRMTFDGETVSLNPSIGNWNLPCRSHYIIDRGRVLEAAPWSDEQIASERSRDKAAKAKFYAKADTASLAQVVAPSPAHSESWGVWIKRRSSNFKWW